MKQYFGLTLPEHLKESIDAYCSEGRPTGGFLECCINNDLSGAIGAADEFNVHLLPAIVGYLYNECPMQAWGRPDSFARWIDKFAGGLAPAIKETEHEG